MQGKSLHNQKLYYKSINSSLYYAYYEFYVLVCDTPMVISILTSDIWQSLGQSDYACFAYLDLLPIAIFFRYRETSLKMNSDH